MKHLFLIILSLVTITATASNFSARLAEFNSLPSAEGTEQLTMWLDSLEANPKAYNEAYQLGEQQFSDPTSELHNESLFLALLKHASESKALSDDERIRPSLLLENAQKNQIGTEANSFEYTTASGETHSLNDNDNRFTLIFFNDPECEACHKVKERIAQSEVVKKLIAEQKLRVLAIYPYDNIEAWEAEKYPDCMINGRDTNLEIDNNAIYDLPSMPVMYLLDENNLVVVKNEASFNRMEKILNTIK